MEFFFDQLYLFIISLVANTLSAMAGGGAGLLQFPALIFLGLPFTYALATHKIATVALGFGATLKHSKASDLNIKFSFFILACGLPGVILGANTIIHIPEHIAKISLGVLTTGLGVFSFLKPKLGQASTAKENTLNRKAIGGFVVFLLGFLNGSLTSGTGLFVTLWLIIWFGLDFKKATAYTMILVGLFWNGSGAFTLALITPVQWSWLPALILASAIGGYLGATLGLKYGNQLIKRFFEAITISVGLSLIASSY